jgi:hypothetical protein
MGEAWAIWTLLVGVPTLNDPTFTTRSACELYRHIYYAESIQEAFKIQCVNISPPLCQGKPCK